MPFDAFDDTTDSLIAPASSCFPIVPDDTLELPSVTKAIYVGGAGDVTLVPLRGGDPVTFRNVGSGTFLDLRVRAVRASGTTATAIVGVS